MLRSWNRSHHFMKIGEKMETVTDFIFLGSKITTDSDCSQEIKRCFFLGRKAMTNLDSILKSRDITLPTKAHIDKAMVFFSSHVLMWELDHKEGLALKNQCFQTVVLEKTLESPLDCKEVKAVNRKRNQPWIYIGRTDTEAETPLLWPPDVKSWLIGKEETLMLGKTEGKKRRGWQMKWLNGIINTMDMSLSKIWEIVRTW